LHYKGFHNVGYNVSKVAWFFFCFFVNENWN